MVYTLMLYILTNDVVNVISNARNGNVNIQNLHSHNDYRGTNYRTVVIIKPQQCCQSTFAHLRELTTRRMHLRYCPLGSYVNISIYCRCLYRCYKRCADDAFRAGDCAHFFFLIYVRAL